MAKVGYMRRALLPRATCTSLFIYIFSSPLYTDSYRLPENCITDIRLQVQKLQ